MVFEIYDAFGATDFKKSPMLSRTDLPSCKSCDRTCLHTQRSAGIEDASRLCCGVERRRLDTVDAHQISLHGICESEERRFSHFLHTKSLFFGGPGDLGLLTNSRMAPIRRPLRVSKNESVGWCVSQRLEWNFQRWNKTVPGLAFSLE